jgi:hypothetical protein
VRPVFWQQAILHPGELGSPQTSPTRHGALLADGGTYTLPQRQERDAHLLSNLGLRLSPLSDALALLKPTSNLQGLYPGLLCPAKHPSQQPSLAYFRPAKSAYRKSHIDPFGVHQVPFSRHPQT